MICPECKGNKIIEGDGYMWHTCTKCNGTGAIVLEIPIVENKEEVNEPIELIENKPKRGRKPKGI